MEAKDPKELRREREQRITNAINLKPTDRIPVVCELGFFVAKYAGIPCSAAYYDCDAWLAAYRKHCRISSRIWYSPGRPLRGRA